MKKKIILTYKLNNKFFYFLKKKFKNIKFIKSLQDSEILNTEAILTFKRDHFEELMQKVSIKKIKKLKWVHMPFVGIENFEYLNNYSSISFTGAKKIQSIQVADHAMAMMLSISRKISFLAKYGLHAKFNSLPTEIKNKRILVVGYGSIGKSIVKRLIGFGPEISILINKTKVKKKNFIKKIYNRKYFSLAIKNKDIIFITIPSNEKNKFMFLSRHFNSMKKKCIIINVSREEIFEPKSLKKIIKKNKDFYLGLDYFSSKFLKQNSYLLREKNVLLTPHIAGLSENYDRRHESQIIENIRKFCFNKNLKNKMF